MGKSSVLELFAELGASTISSDVIVSGLLEEPAVIEKIRGLFGESIVGSQGKLDKKAIANRVFQDSADRLRLEEVLHPLVFKEIDAAARRPEVRGRLVVVEVPLLFESRGAGGFDITITVHTAYELAVSRLMKKGISRGEAVARLDSQMRIEEKLRCSDYAIDNSGSMEETKKQVAAMFPVLTQLMATAEGRPG